MIFSEGSRYNKYESNTINKRINGPPILFSKQTKKKRGTVAKRRRKESVSSEMSEAMVTFVRAAILTNNNSYKNIITVHLISLKKIVFSTTLIFTEYTFLESAKK